MTNIVLNFTDPALLVTRVWGCMADDVPQCPWRGVSPCSLVCGGAPAVTHQDTRSVAVWTSERKHLHAEWCETGWHGQEKQRATWLLEVSWYVRHWRPVSPVKRSQSTGILEGTYSVKMVSSINQIRKEAFHSVPYVRQINSVSGLIE